MKVALTPVAIIKDAGNIVVGNDADSTKTLLNDAANDVQDAFDDLTGN